MSADKTPEELCALAIEGIATAADQEAIQRLLRDDPNFRALYLRQMRCHALLKWRSGQAIQATESPVNLTGPHLEKKSSAKKVWFSLLACVAASLIVGVFLSWPSKAIQFEVLSSTLPAYPVGWKSPEQRLAFGDGSLKIRLTTGELVEIAGPAEIELTKPQELKLINGDISVDTSSATGKLVIENHGGHLLDASGQYSVNSSADGSTEIAVFQGQARWQGVFAQQVQQPTPLSEGQALEVDAQQNQKRLEFVRLRSDAPNLLQKRIPGDSIVTAVTDNSQQHGAMRFYSITPRGMIPGAKPYPVMDLPRWQPLEGSNFPTELLGADLVGTFNLDRLDTNRRISLQLAAPCTVYVMFDERTQVPEWLSRNFEQTEFGLRSGPWHTDNPIIRGLDPNTAGEYFMTYRVWKKQLMQAGNLEFGPPRTATEPSARAMYGIAVKPQEK